MLVEEIPNGKRFRCNDIGFATNFDKIVFRIEDGDRRSGESDQSSEKGN
jgi:hypothetical protein